MSIAGAPSTFPGGLTAQFLQVGAAQQNGDDASLLGAPALFPGGFTEQWIDAGAAQRDVAAGTFDAVGGVTLGGIGSAGTAAGLLVPRGQGNWDSGFTGGYGGI